MIDYSESDSMIEIWGGKLAESKTGLNIIHANLS